MPDLFDQLAAAGSATAANDAQPNFLQQMRTQRATPATPAQSGDLFDQFAADRSSAAPQAQAPDAFTQIASQRAADPFSQIAAQRAVATPTTPPAPEGHSFLGNLGRGVISSFAPVAAGLEDAAGLAAHFGLMGPGGDEMASAAWQAANRTRAYQPDEGSVGGTVGQVAGAIPQMLTGPAGLASQVTGSGLGALDTAEAQHAAGNISNMQELGDVAGQTALAYATGKIGQSGVTGKLLSNVLPEATGVAGRLAATGVVEGANNTLNQVVGNQINKSTGVTPGQDVLEGAPGAFAGGAAMGVGGQALHLAAGQKPAGQPPAPTDDAMFQDAKFTDHQGNVVSIPQGTDASDIRSDEPEPTHRKTNPDDAMFQNATFEAPTDRVNPSLIQKMIDGANSPDETPQRRLADKAAADQTEQQRIQRAMFADRGTPDTGRRVGDWSQVSDDRKNILQQMREKQISSDAGKNPEAPAELPDAKAVGKWYGYRFNDPDNAGMIEALAGTAKGKYRLADVPADQVDANTLGNDVDQSKVDAVSKLDPDQRAKLPPGILIPGADDKLTVADGTHRLLGRQQAGDNTYRAYVPEDAIGKNGVTAAGETTKLADKAPSGHAALPDLDEHANWLKRLWTSANVKLGTGIGLTNAEKATKLDVNQSQGELDRHIAQMDSALEPARQAMEGLSTNDATGAQWLDHAEATGQSMHPDPASQAALDLHGKLNEANIKQGERLGLNTDKWGADWIGRLFVKDDSKASTAPGGGNSSLQGRGGFRFSRDYDSYSEAFAAAKASGLKPLYDNPIDMMLAKQAEVARFLKTKELLRGQEDNKALTWVPDGEKPPEGAAQLQDRSATEERELHAPRWMAGKIGSLNTFEGNRYIQDQQERGNFNPVRPGDEPPVGQVGVGRNVRGSYYGSPTTTHLFDSLIDTLPADSPVKMLSSAAKAISGLQYAMGTAHAGVAAMGNVGLMTGTALDNLAHGEIGAALTNLAKGIDPTFSAGRNLRNAMYRDPAAPYGPVTAKEDIARRVAAANPELAPKSSLMKHSWDDVKDAWENQSPAVGFREGVRYVAGYVHDSMSEYVKNAKAQYQGSLAENAQRRGLTQQEGRVTQSEAQSVSDSALGFAGSKARFQDNLYKAVRDMAFSAGQYTEGPIRLGAGSIKGTLQGIGAALRDDTANVKFTPAMQAVLGGFASLAATNAMLQLATTSMNGHAIAPTGLDFLRFRTGKKNDEGRDERVTLPGFATGLIEMATKPGGFLFNRLNPIARGVTEDIQKKGYNGPIYNKSDSGLMTAGKAVAHVAGDALPRAIGGSTGDGIAEKGLSRFGGVQFSHPVSSKAEAKAYDLISQHGDFEKTEHSMMVSQLAQQLRKDGSNAFPVIRQAIRDGKITPDDGATIRRRAAEPSGLVGIIKGDELSADETMQVWNLATDQEKKQIQMSVRGKLGRAKDVPLSVKHQYADTISGDLRSMKD